MTDSMGDALKHLYKEKVLGAPVRDPQKTDTTPLTDRYVGLLDFTSMVLWALEVCSRYLLSFKYVPSCQVFTTCRMRFGSIVLHHEIIQPHCVLMQSKGFDGRVSMACTMTVTAL